LRTARPEKLHQIRSNAEKAGNLRENKRLEKRKHPFVRLKFYFSPVGGPLPNFTGSTLTKNQVEIQKKNQKSPHFCVLAAI
jgi:hypothetical protein